tara:strand:+ start:1295 stop:1804 length:510 start_codon:yes stop_codon:yes gene_type:complete
MQNKSNLRSFLIYILLSFLLSFNLNASENDLTIEIDNPRFSEKGLDEKQYEIKAERGLKSGENLKLFFVEGKFKTSGGTWIYLKADTGEYNQLSNMIDLNRNVEIISDSNDSIIADGANFDLANDIILLKKNIVYKKNKNTVTSDRSKIIDNFNYITYQGNVITTLFVE